MNTLEIVAIVVLCVLGVINILPWVLTAMLPEEGYIMSRCKKLLLTQNEDDNEQNEDDNKT